MPRLHKNRTLGVLISFSSTSRPWTDLPWSSEGCPSSTAFTGPHGAYTLRKPTDSLGGSLGQESNPMLTTEIEKGQDLFVI